MTTLRHLKLAAQAGEPDDVLALRIDVVAAAVAWYEALPIADPMALDDAETSLERAVRRYQRAVKRRQAAPAIRP